MKSGATLVETETGLFTDEGAIPSASTNILTALIRDAYAAN